MIFIENNNLDPALNHAIELYVMDKYDEDVFMLWRNNPCILIGRYQNINLEVNLDFTISHGIEVVRRLSGGGAIYCDTENMQYTFITKKTSSENSFVKFALPVVKALKSLGLNAEFTGRNDIQINGAKVSGNAQFHRGGKVIHHGTLLFKANTENLVNSLKVRDIKFKDKSVHSVASRIGFIGDMIGMNVEEFKSHIETFIKKEYDIKSTTFLSVSDMEKIEKIKQEIFATKEWNYGNSSGTKKITSAEKYLCGIVEIGLEIQNGKIQSCSIEGDFFSELGVDGLCKILTGVECSENGIKNALSKIDASIMDKYIQLMKKEIFIDSILKMIKSPLIKGEYND